MTYPHHMGGKRLQNIYWNKIYEARYPKPGENSNIAKKQMFIHTFLQSTSQDWLIIIKLKLKEFLDDDRHHLLGNPETHNNILNRHLMSIVRTTPAHADLVVNQGHSGCFGSLLMRQPP